MPTLPEDALLQLIRDDRYWKSWHPDYNALRNTVASGFQALYPDRVHVETRTRHDSDRDVAQIADPKPAAPGGGARSARASGKRIIYENPDGAREVREGGSLAWRTNNPGNLYYGPFAIDHGAIGRSGSFTIFPNEATGEAALEDWLRHPDRRNKTLDEMIRGYAPPQQNDTAAYQRFVRDRLGMPGDTQLRDLTPAQSEALRKIIRTREGWKPGTIRRIEAGDR